MTVRLKQVLGELGLSGQEIEIYLQLLKSTGVLPASTIAKQLKMNRTTAYKALLRLTKIGLVTKTMKHGIICFLAEGAEQNIKSRIEQRYRQLESTQLLFLNSVDDLKEVYKEQFYVPSVRFYEGIEGVKRVYEDTLHEGQTIYAFENPADMADEIYDYICRDFLPRRVQEGIFSYVISPDNTQSVNFKTSDEKNKRETRLLPKKKLPFQIEINIYGDKIAFFSYRKNELFATIIKGKTISQSMLAIFNICWGVAN